MEPAKKLPLADLPADVVQHILIRLTLAHHIARTAPTCKVVSVAARNAIKARRFSSEVVILAGLGKVMGVVLLSSASGGRSGSGAAVQVRLA